MRSIFSLCMLVVLFIPATSNAQTTYFDKLRSYRDSVDAEFSDMERTILKQEDLTNFFGLHYYEADMNYRVKAKFKAIKDGQVVKMKTSGNRMPEYRPYGLLTFKLEGKKCKLTLYQSADTTRPELKNYILLAFTDRTNGFDTYGGGRYIEYTVSDIKKDMIVDFNYCFNPYCAYSDRYSCVVPPPENALKVPVRAGVKKFHD